jgi:ribosome-binding factor A
VLGDAGEREATLDGLRHAHGHLQARIAGQLGLKRTPTLEFVYDETGDRARRVDELIEAADMPDLVDEGVR